MNRFSYMRAESLGEAIAAVASDPGARFIAGGTNLVDLMKYNVEKPVRLVDITRLPLNDIEATEAGGLKIGALVPNSDLAYDERVAKDYPLLSSAILAGASAQLRNAATTGGNLTQRTRCYYFYDAAVPCNKREPGSGCPAMTGHNRIHAILGASGSCIATHPSDMCVALAALDATVHVHGPDGAREITIGDFHRLPGDEPQRDNTLSHGEAITAIELPAPRFGAHHTYIKLRDRLSYAFALVSVAAAIELDGDVISEARVALGGVAAKPWRDEKAEESLKGEMPASGAFEAFADKLLAGAKGHGGNDFKVELARRAIVRALGQAAAGTPQVQSHKTIN